MVGTEVHFIERLIVNETKRCVFLGWLELQLILRLEYVRAPQNKYIFGTVVRAWAACTGGVYQRTYFLSCDEEDRCELF